MSTGQTQSSCHGKCNDFMINSMSCPKFNPSFCCELKQLVWVTDVTAVTLKPGNHVEPGDLHGPFPLKAFHVSVIPCPSLLAGCTATPQSCECLIAASQHPPEQSIQARTSCSQLPAGLSREELPRQKLIAEHILLLWSSDVTEPL